MSDPGTVCPAPEIARWLDEMTAAWRAGDQAAVLARLSNDPAVAMGGPQGAIPIAIGPDAVRAMVERLVTPLPAGSGVFPVEVKAFAAGDIAWANADCELRLPARPLVKWFIVLVLRREPDGWKALNFGAFAGPPVEPGTRPPSDAGAPRQESLSSRAALSWQTCALTP